MAVFGVLLCKLFGLVISPNPLPFTADSENKREEAVFVLPALTSLCLFFNTDCKSSITKFLFPQDCISAKYGFVVGLDRESKIFLYVCYVIGLFSFHLELDGKLYKKFFLKLNYIIIDCKELVLCYFTQSPNSTRFSRV